MWDGWREIRHCLTTVATPPWSLGGKWLVFSGGTRWRYVVRICSWIDVTQAALDGDAPATYLLDVSMSSFLSWVPRCWDGFSVERAWVEGCITMTSTRDAVPAAEGPPLCGHRRRAEVDAPYRSISIHVPPALATMLVMALSTQTPASTLETPVKVPSRHTPKLLREPSTPPVHAQTRHRALDLTSASAPDVRSFSVKAKEKR